MAGRRKWSGEVTRHSDALDLKDGVFKSDDPHAIASSLKESAQASKRRKSGAFRSAMSMLTFYVNRAGGNLTRRRKMVLDAAKNQLRAEFGRNSK